MQHRIYILFAVALTVSISAWREADAQDNGPAEAAVRAYREIQQIEQEENQATAGLQAEYNAVRQTRHQLQQEPPDDERLAAMQKQLDYHRQRVKQLEMELKAAKTKDPEKRKAWADDLKKKEKALRAKLKEAEEPFEQRQDALLSGMTQEAEAFKEMMRGFALTPTDDYPGVSIGHYSTNFGQAFVAYHWKGDDGKMICWAHLRIREQRDSIGRGEKLNGKYPIQSSSDNSMWFWAGDVQVAFVVSDDKYKDEKKIKQMATKFLDVAGLANVDVPEADKP